jgi:hypothetical protein
MDDMVHEEIFEQWLRTLVLADEVPWILRHSVENFQALQLMEFEWPQDFVPVRPVRQPRTLQNLRKYLEPPNFTSDMGSIGPALLLDDQHRYLSITSLGIKLVPRLSATRKMPCLATLPLQCNALMKANGAESPPVLPAELEELESASLIIAHRKSGSHERCMFICTPTLGVILEAARLISPVLSSSAQGSSLNKLQMFIVIPNVAVKQEEATNVLNSSRSLLQDPSSDRLRTSISAPSLGIKLEATKMILGVFISLPQVSSLDEQPMFLSESGVNAKLEAAQNMLVAAKSLAKNSSFGGLHMFISIPSLGVRLGITDSMPAFLETPSELGLSPFKGATLIDPEFEVRKSKSREKSPERDRTSSICKICDPSNMNIRVANDYATERVNALSQAHEANFEISTEDPKRFELLPFPFPAADILVSTPHDAEGVIENMPSTASYQPSKVSFLDLQAKPAARGHDEISTTPEPASSHEDVGHGVMKKPLQSKKTAPRRDNPVEFTANRLDRRAWLSRSQGMAIRFISYP